MRTRLIKKKIGYELHIWSSDTAKNFSTYWLYEDELDCIDYFLTIFERSTPKNRGYAKRTGHCLRNYIYYLLVWEHTDKSIDKALEGTVIDHIVPIYEGYKNSIVPWLIGGRDNLRHLNWKDNLRKGYKITSDSLEVLENWKIKIE